MDKWDCIDQENTPQSETYKKSCAFHMLHYINQIINAIEKTKKPFVWANMGDPGDRCVVVPLSQEKKN